MRHPHQPTTIAILGTITLSEMILAQLLEDEGYDTRLLEAPLTGFIDEELNDADVLLHTPGQENANGLATFLGAVRSVPVAVSIPILPLSPTLKLALLDEQAVSVPWKKQFQQLVRQIEDALSTAHAETNLV